ncbi:MULTISPECIES: hypothetical protein [unclassified Prochlorococcus]|uniref:hypothetical protein n=1 Tax=unclassified Prochlorococcus TaxID=2627481 RepID=UPI0005339728|nr:MULTISPECIES: hypothetical protein [unclassified Prochlorococcus]KGG16446.1 hypothetical protein EV06_0283 [Prochlorococcus sp. MIT 0602]KGG17080.1 hypothetical protein EV07_0511 [Prochlorococcus sp. MIT 0603]
MAVPRWQEVKEESKAGTWKRWENVLAIIAMVNFSWIIFDVSYIPLRNFWASRSIYLFNSSTTSISLRWIPDITNYYDQIKGIQANPLSNEIKNSFAKLDKTISKNGIRNQSVKELLSDYQLLINNFVEFSQISSQKDLDGIKTIKASLKERSGEINYKSGYKKLLSINYLSQASWKNEKAYWKGEILGVINAKYSRSINKNGLYTSNSWKIDLPFQIIFLIDILMRVLRLKSSHPNIKLSNAFIRRWFDLLLLLPFFRLLRVLPITERILSLRLISIEPIRSAISQWIVGLLAIEILEVLTIRTIDSLQDIIGSPKLPERVRDLCSYQSTYSKQSSNSAELLRIWLPLILRKIGPNMRGQIIALSEHALQRSIKENGLQRILKSNLVIEKAESAISQKIASGMVDTILGISKKAGDQFAQKDVILEDLTINAIDKFWEELAIELEGNETLGKTQILLLSILDEFKFASLNQVTKQSKVDRIISNLNKIILSSEKAPPNSAD